MVTFEAVFVLTEPGRVNLTVWLAWPLFIVTLISAVTCPEAKQATDLPVPWFASGQRESSLMLRNVIYKSSAGRKAVWFIFSWKDWPCIMGTEVASILGLG